MSSEYRNNHYVPVWYQKRFLPAGQKNQELFYLDLRPPVSKDSRGGAHPHRSVRQLGFKHCFRQRDLYTTYLGSQESTGIEETFFGSIDRAGRVGVEYLANFAHPSLVHDALKNLLVYMSTQRLRTPKGLGWLKEQTGAADKNHVLEYMLRLQQLYCAIWTECVWLIADASRSETKFIISDHPVTVYNRRCGPRSQWCRGFNDPEISFQGTHTIFPLSLEKILILTNLSWVRNPYQYEVLTRPNPNPFRGTIFDCRKIQTLRSLDEREVRQINFIIKSRAHRYLGAAKVEWLYPERQVSKSDWYTFGHGYLLMPDPRGVHLGGRVMWGNRDGTAGAIDEYGRRPWQQDYGREGKTLEEAATLFRFQGEFARLFGRYRRGRTFDLNRLDEERDGDEAHKYHLDLENKRKSRRKR